MHHILHITLINVSSRKVFYVNNEMQNKPGIIGQLLFITFTYTTFNHTAMIIRHIPRQAIIAFCQGTMYMSNPWRHNRQDIIIHIAGKNVTNLIH